MNGIDEDDRPTRLDSGGGFSRISGSDDQETRSSAPTSGGNYGRSSGTPPRETRSSGQASAGHRSRPGEGGDRPTIVRPRTPQISSVAWLYCRKGLRVGHLYQLRKERNEIGRAIGSDVEIEDELAGNHHGAILLVEEAWQIHDFASKNGTTVNGKRLGTDTPSPTPLEDGDVVVIGDTEMVFKKV